MMESISRPSTSNEIQRRRRTDRNFETYFLVWLDASIYSQENSAAQEILRSTITYLQEFDQLDECEDYIQSLSLEDRIVFIVSGHFGQEIVPRIHHLRQVSAIYIYYTNKQFHQQWSNQYRKVISVASRILFFKDFILGRRCS